MISATSDLDIGFLVYCAGADPNFTPFLSSPLEAAESLVQRNCMVPMQLCHHYAQPMVERGRGGIVIFGSGAGFAGGPEHGGLRCEQGLRHGVRRGAVDRVARQGH